MDTFLLWVNPKSGIKNIDDFVKAVKAKKGKWTMGGTGKMQEDQLVTNMLMQAYGLKGMITYVPFRGGGTVAKNLAGGHVDSTVNNPSEGLPHYPGKMRPIAALTPERIPAFKEVPTFKELGQPQLVYFMQRSINAPGGISKDAVKWYTDLFNKLCNSKEWKRLYVEEGAEPRLPERRSAGQILRLGRRETQEVAQGHGIAEKLAFGEESRCNGRIGSSPSG